MASATWETSFTPTRRSRRWVRRLAVLAVVGGLIALFLPAIVAKTPLRHLVLGQVSGLVDGSVAVDSLELSWLGPVVLEGVTLRDPDGETVVTVERVATDKSLLSLATAGGDYGTVTVQKPALDLKLTDAGSNLERVLRPVLSQSSPPSASRPAVKLVVVDAEVTLSHPATTPTRLHSREVTVAVPGTVTESIQVRGTLDADDSGEARQLIFEIDAGGAVVGTLRTSGFPLAAVEPAVKRFLPGYDLAGRLSGDCHAKYADQAVEAGGVLTVADCRVLTPYSDGEELKLARLSADAEAVEYRAGRVQLKNTAIESDVGRLHATAEFDTEFPVNELFRTPGLSLDLNVDVAKLVNAVPRLLRLKPGTSLTDGHLTAKISSQTQGQRVVWTSQLETTALKGTRDGRAIGWDRAMTFRARGHLREADSLPVFEEFTWQADFVSLIGQGSVEQFAVNANLDFDRLAARLGEFVDLGGSSLGGRGLLAVQCEPSPEGNFQLGASLKAENFRYANTQGQTVTEPKMMVTLVAGGHYKPLKPLRIDTATARFTVGDDRLEAVLDGPVADLKSATGGTAKLALDGELARWAARVGEFIPALATTKIAGTGPIRATVAVTPEAVRVESLTAQLSRVEVVNDSLDLREPTLKVETQATYSRPTRALTLENVVVHGPTLVVTTPRAEVGLADGTVKSKLAVTADLGRVCRAFRLDSVPLYGLAVGTLHVEPQAGSLAFNADFKVTDFLYGDPADPTWRDPWLAVRSLGQYLPGAGEVDFRTLAVEREGLRLEGDAVLKDPSRTLTLSGKGNMHYDLAKLEPKLKELLGSTVAATGTGARPFAINGSLADWRRLSVTAGLSWDRLTAYGFTADAGELTATANGGVVTTTPVAAGFGGGVVRVEPTIDLNAPGMVMTVKNGRLIDKTRLTPEACASALGYALPAFANAAQARGEVTFDLTQNRIPLADFNSAELHGVLTVHSADVSAGPVAERVLTLLGADRTAMTLSGTQQVPVAYKVGRVYHEKFSVRLGQSEVISTGSVGTDQTLDLVLDTPLPPKVVNAALAKNPRIREALAGQRVKLPVHGTLKQPALDDRAVGQVAGGLLRDTAREVIRDGAGDLQEKLRQKLRDELEKKLPFGPRK